MDLLLPSTTTMARRIGTLFLYPPHVAVPNGFAWYPGQEIPQLEACGMRASAFNTALRQNKRAMKAAPRLFAARPAYPVIAICHFASTSRRGTGRLGVPESSLPDVAHSCHIP